MFRFECINVGLGPRRGRLLTAHGPMDTPAFMPVGTQATVKGLTGAMVASTGAQAVLANAYHLMVRPGTDIIARLGGLHRVMAWDRVIVTDSGGYQVFSLGRNRRVGDEGVLFANHVDGGQLLLTPRSVIQAQHDLGGDIIMPLDECVPADADHPTAAEAVRRTTLWAGQCRQVHGEGGRADQTLFGIVQGGQFADLRRQAVNEIAGMGFSGYAIGGLSVGEGRQRMVEMLALTTERLPADRPRYLMGVGEPGDLLAAVACGTDMFDCVLPTRNGRNGRAFTADGPLRLRNERYRTDDAPIEADCDCESCRGYCRGVLRHLLLADEMLGPVLVSLHNLRFFQRLMEQVRAAIEAGTFDLFARKWLARYQSGNN